MSNFNGRTKRYLVSMLSSADCGGEFNTVMKAIKYIYNEQEKSPLESVKRDVEELNETANTKKNYLDYRFVITDMATGKVIWMEEEV